MKILLEAPVLTQSGYGEHSRLVYRAIKSHPGVEIYINPLEWGKTGWSSSYSKEREEIEQCIRDFQTIVDNAKKDKASISFDMQIHVGIPNEFEKRAAYSICVTAGIETDRVSANWLMKTHKGIDKIIVPSSHAKEGFDTTHYEIINQENTTKTILSCNSPVEVVPYPVKTQEEKHINFKLDTEFNFLSVALLGPRKNMENMIKWFVEEFENENVGLVVKTGKVNGSVIDRDMTVNHLKPILNQYPNRKCKVYLLHGDLSEPEIHSLYNRKDIHAYISATHGEGFGLPIFESAYSGLPIVATDWSGHLDFLVAPKHTKGKGKKDKKLFARVNYELKEIPKEAVWKDILEEGSKWAYPIKSSFKTQIRNMYKSHGMYKKWAQTLKDSILKTHSEEIIYEKMRNAIFHNSELAQEEEQEEEIILL